MKKKVRRMDGQSNDERYQGTSLRTETDIFLFKNDNNDDNGTMTRVLSSKGSTICRLSKRSLLVCFVNLAILQIFFIAHVTRVQIEAKPDLSRNQPEANSSSVATDKYPWAYSMRDNNKFYQNVPMSSSNNLWDDDPAIPKWLKHYLTWHRYTRRARRASSSTTGVPSPPKR